MRTFVISMVCLNLLYFIWISLVDKKSTAVEAPRLVAPRSLQLMVEVGLNEVVVGDAAEMCIVFGQLSSTVSGDEFVSKLNELGFPGGVVQVVQENDGESEEIRVFMAGMALSELPELEWQAIVEEYPALKQEEKLCETIAPKL